MNILQQIIELGTETHDATAVASVVAMAPGTVTVVKQVRALPSPTVKQVRALPSPALSPTRLSLAFLSRSWNELGLVSCVSYPTSDH